MKTAYPIIIGGENFGCGSSREHAPVAMGAAGGQVVVAQSYARIFFRNCVATGELYPVEAADGTRLCDELATGEEVEVDMEADTLKVVRTGKVFSLKPLGEVRFEGRGEEERERMGRGGGERLAALGFLSLSRLSLSLSLSLPHLPRPAPSSTRAASSSTPASRA